MVAGVEHPDTIATAGAGDFDGEDVTVELTRMLAEERQCGEYLVSETSCRLGRMVVHEEMAFDFVAIRVVETDHGLGGARWNATAIEVSEPDVTSVREGLRECHTATASRLELEPVTGWLCRVRAIRRPERIGNGLSFVVEGDHGLIVANWACVADGNGAPTTASMVMIRHG